MSAAPIPHPRRFAFSLRTLFAVIALIGLSLVSADFVLSPFLPSNCGGNSAALWACKGYVSVLAAWEFDRPNQAFHYDDVDSETRRELAHLIGDRWIGSARILAKLNNVHIDPAGPRQIVVVCDRAYNNVPQRALWNSPMAHAVGYSTGAIGLISPDEFARLDLNDFVDLQTEFQKISD